MTPQPTGAAAPAQEPFAYAVYFPDQPCEELVHDLDELLDDMTNREHTITKLYDHPSPQPAVTAEAVDALPDEKTCVDYVLQYGGRCRDCADENGICPGSGLPCGGQRKAVTHVVQALRYGLQHGYLRAAQRGGAA